MLSSLKVFTLLDNLPVNKDDMEGES